VPLGIQAFNVSKGYHLALPRSIAPYIPQKFYSYLTVTPSTVDSTYVVLAQTIGGQTSLADGFYSTLGYIGLSGEYVSTNYVNLSTSLYWNDWPSMGSATAGYASMAPVALSAEIHCNSSQATSAGDVYFGRLNTNIDLADVNINARTWYNLIGSTVGRPGISLQSYFQLYKNQHIHATPMDPVEYETFRPAIPGGGVTPLSTVQFSEAMTPLVFMFPRVPTAGTSYTIRVGGEFRVRYPISFAASTLHRKHAPSSQSTWNRAVHEAESIGEYGAEALGVVGGLVAASTAAPEFAAAAGFEEALPAIRALGRGRIGRMGPRL